MKVMSEAGSVLIVQNRRAPNGKYPKPGYKPFALGTTLLTTSPTEYSGILFYTTKAGQAYGYLYGPWKNTDPEGDTLFLCVAGFHTMDDSATCGGYCFNGAVRGQCYLKFPV